MPFSLANTRSSRCWTSRKPGNWDRLNLRAVFDAGNEWGIPDLPVADWIPSELIAFGSRRGMARAQSLSAVHFFLDDYRFETVWNRPEQFVERIDPCGALTPDFSTYTDMPLAMQLWQTYRNRWCGAWLAHHDVRVIPTVGWSDRRSFDFTFEGIPKGSVVATSAVGIKRDRVARHGFYVGYEEMLRRIEPATVLMYGAPLPGLGGDIRVYPTRWASDG